LSLVQADPDWSKMHFPHLQEMPGIRWKLANLDKLRAKHHERFTSQHTELTTRFG
jgi:hypothetical protein